MKVYHGSYTEIREIDLSKGARYRDFGQGFYVTKFRRHAKDWAAKIGRKHGNKGYVTEFNFHETCFGKEQYYKILRFNGYTDEWLDFVIMNRDTAYREQQHDCDFVEGPVANDKIQFRLRQFLRGRISREKFLEELLYHEETHQICFCTLKSLQLLELFPNETVWNIEEIGEALLEALMLDNNIDEIKAANLFYSSGVFVRLENEADGLCKRPWQEIYEMLKKELNSSP
jgi:hypothetical protein